MLTAVRRWWEARAAVRQLLRSQARERAAFAFLVHEKLDEAAACIEGGDKARAARLWEEAFAADPVVARSSPRTVHVLIGIGRPEEAEAVMAEGMRRHLAEPLYAEGFAHVARARGDLPEAVRRWEAMRAAFPRSAAAHRLGSQALVDAGRIDEAEALMSDACARLPPDLLLRMEHARVAALRNDWPEALARWEVVARYGHQSAMSGRAEALRGLGRFDEADAALAEARMRFPLEVEPAFESARVAESRGDLPEAARRWGEAARRFPAFLHAHEREIEAWIAAGDDAAAEAALDRAADRFPEDGVRAAARAGIAARRGA
jgi:tetratricopeptide (TPR) repeat protein